MMLEDNLHSMWSRGLFDSLNDGGIWAVPRSGLLFRREGARLVLTERMPHEDAMPITASQLEEGQDADLKSITHYFALAGIEVI